MNGSDGQCQLEWAESVWSTVECRASWWALRTQFTVAALTELMSKALTIAIFFTGTVLGAIAGFLYTNHLVAQSIEANPNDPSAGSVGIVSMFFVPIGAVIGFGFSLLVGIVIEGLKNLKLRDK